MTPSARPRWPAPLSSAKRQIRARAPRYEPPFVIALAADYDAVVTLDADGQHDPAELPKFLAAYAEKQPDLIIGQRRLRHMPPIRRLANYLGRKSFSWAIGQPIPDNQSGYRLISPPAAGGTGERGGSRLRI